MTYLQLVSSSRPMGPRACIFWVGMPISAPSPTSPPPVHRGAAGPPDAAGRPAGTGHADGGGARGAGEASGAGGAETGSAPAPDEAPAVVDAGAYCTYRAVPQYPAGMIQAGASGRVTIEIEVSPESAVTSVESVRSAGYGALDQAAVSAGWQCRFQMNGHPGRYRTTYRFELQGGDDW